MHGIPMHNGGGCGTTGLASFYDLMNHCPRSPLELLLFSSIDATNGALAFSTSFNNPSGTWAEASARIAVSAPPEVDALGTDDKQKFEKQEK